VEVKIDALVAPAPLSVLRRVTLQQRRFSMAANPPQNMTQITPYLYYENVAEALDWLSKAFGFRERMRMPGPDGKIIHAEMEWHSGVIMLGWPGAEYRNPKRLGGVTQNLYVYVDDVDRHYDHAKQAGAKIFEQPADQFYGDRRYGVEDIEGHRWFFAQHVRDVAPEDLKLPDH
jgi:PhnB protein